MNDLLKTKLLTTRQFKLDKSLKVGYLTCGINLSPHNEAALFLDEDIPSVCPMAGYCGNGCLNKTGMNQMTTHLPARVKRTLFLIKHPKEFILKASQEIERQVVKAERESLEIAVRPNLLSDQPKMARALARQFRNVQFYDYTKIRAFHRNVMDNYHLTYSYSERTRELDVIKAMNAGINIAVIFAVKKKDDLPASVILFGRELEVIDGDEHDLRFLDPKGVVVGLRWKGSHVRMAEAVEAGFALEV